jgi:hypothetical protein
VLKVNPGAIVRLCVMILPAGIIAIMVKRNVHQQLRGRLRRRQHQQHTRWEASVHREFVLVMRRKVVRRAIINIDVIPIAKILPDSPGGTPSLPRPQ